MNNYTADLLKRSIVYWQTLLLIMEAVDDIVKSNMLFENGDDVSLKIISYIGKDVKSPKDIKKFIENNKDKYEKSLEKLDDEKKPLYKKVWEYLCYAAGKSIKFIIDNFLTILKLIAIIALGWLAWPYLKKIKDLIDSLRKDKERDEKELEIIQNDHEIMQQNTEKAKSVVDIMVDDPSLLNNNLPKEFKPFSQELIDFLKTVPKEKRELIQKWITNNAGKEQQLLLTQLEQLKKLTESYLRRKLESFINSDDSDEHVPHDNIIDGRESIIVANDAKYPHARYNRFINAIRSIKDSRGKHKFTPWNDLMKDVENWNKHGEPITADELRNMSWYHNKK